MKAVHKRRRRARVDHLAQQPCAFSSGGKGARYDFCRLLGGSVDMPDQPDCAPFELPPVDQPICTDWPPLPAPLAP
eukprot:CAMPEP_0205930732 /NCGR_PEP_ID=MMETSP1325-20131115/26066_1 /ASSEMBLY_ACC=CAM_ASM_000708 /TAXON_ID=236786 /ORGANISM="Florenciella sp., Strain RCC1007" /LENGTH=75 /DNA_ID=CAMNT_0053300165 /DNA_START=66 /DNA_END=289 /DNA_ORIENTATION=-